jgi:hypothetical protein
MGFGYDMDGWEETGPHKAAFKEKEEPKSWMLSKAELKLLTIAGARFQRPTALFACRASAGRAGQAAALCLQRTS